MTPARSAGGTAPAPTPAPAPVPTADASTADPARAAELPPDATDAVRAYLVGLQAAIVARLEAIDGTPFLADPWQRAEGGGGLSRVLEDGGVFERAGVLFSEVEVSKLPPSASAAHPQIAGRAARAMGVSLVLHPRNPHVPTVHMNVRFFVAPAHDGAPAVWWFGGGMDLTPYYPHEADAVHFHRSCKAALDPFGPDWYPRFKRWCDEYFFLKHRNEARGIGGVFFDDLAEPGFAQSFAMMRGVGSAFVDAYCPIVERRRALPYGEPERRFQALRRGRYVEFNLVYDRGTLFGLHSGGRTESILCSMPPAVAWRYGWQPEPGSAEARLLTDFLPPRDWV